MNIIGPDALVFGVDDLAACRQYLIDYGLSRRRPAAASRRWTARPSSIRAKDDATLPPGLGTASMLRETVYGVADAATLDAIEAELRRDREVTRRDGVAALPPTTWASRSAFQVTVRRPIAPAGRDRQRARRRAAARAERARRRRPTCRRCRARCRTSSTSCPTRPRPRPSTRGWASSAPTASRASAPSCARPARWTTTRCS